MKLRSQSLLLFAVLFAVLHYIPYEFVRAAPGGQSLIIERLRNDGIEYALYLPGETDRSGRKSARDELLAFDRTFRAARSEVFALHGEREPRSMSVALAGDARIFSKLTGRPWYVAGLYEPESRRLIFQNSAALRRRGILARTVRHELCHALIAETRGTGTRNSSAPAWLEEGYCEALGDLQPANATHANASQTNPSRDACTEYAATIHNKIRAATTLADFAAWLAAGMHLSGAQTNAQVDRRNRRQAFCAAALFASDWVANAGRDRAFAYLTGRVQSQPAVQHSTNLAELERDYARFRGKFLRSHVDP